MHRVVIKSFLSGSPGLRVARSQVTPAGQGDDLHRRLLVGRTRVIYLSLLTLRVG